MCNQSRKEHSMHIIGRIQADNAGRIAISKLFDKPPKRVLVVFDTSTKKLFFVDTNSEKKTTGSIAVDHKGRVCLPKWILEELGKEYFITEDYKEEPYLLPKKFCSID